MNGIHDMGGMHGFGPVEIERDEPVFHEPWEGRVWGMLRQLRGRLGEGAGASRDVMEHMDPVSYLTASYYERFLHAAEQRAIARGLITGDELRDRRKLLQEHPDTPVPRREDPAAVAAVRSTLRSQARPEPSGPPPRFKPGEAVSVRNLHPEGHTRLPRYIRGKRGVIERVNGWYAIEDSDKDLLGPNPQTVYTVGFDGREVWGETAEPNVKVYLEMWEGYLEDNR